MHDNETKLLISSEVVDFAAKVPEKVLPEIMKDEDHDMFYDRVPPLSPATPMTPLSNFIAESNFLAPEIR